MIAGYLCWSDVDPRQRAALDPARVTAIVRPLVEAARAHRTEHYREKLVETLERELIVELGAWIAGWTWSANETGGGGPVHGWCCAEHSVFPQQRDEGGPRTDRADADDDPVGATIMRVVTSVEDWARVLDETAALFAELRAEAPVPAPGGDRASIALAAELAASRVLPYVIDRTRAEDAWYGTFARILGWYLESAGHDAGAVAVAIDETIGGKFESWMEPAEDVARETCEAIGRAIAGHELESRDATARWLEARTRKSPHHARSEYPPVRADGHQRYIDRADHARDPDRAERMSAALVLCRDSARRGMRLTFDQMCEWQAAVLGESRVDFRTGPAFAKGGREKYPFSATTTRRQFEQLLAETATAKTPLAMRAANVYLDVCFFHPFPDGNARAARLALDHVLASAGFALHAAEPVFLVSRSARDRNLRYALAYVLERLMGPFEF